MKVQGNMTSDERKAAFSKAREVFEEDLIPAAKRGYHGEHLTMKLERGWAIARELIESFLVDEVEPTLPSGKTAKVDNAG